ncbi:FAD-binding oxidoreductase [Pseudoroseicyclus aestuarii]|uniref:FAD/FMN-containing dehydrogenase n=1 Tax=Pseudoroseicyclus aestuarii TaxID=1795041 RepID=A0A318STD2_9RHOB|nr:FAD-binding oxidoreductase [Pseudoroseicyclus aestuarii]PYE85100.1 FAD/FMN-containing dehydrogenase [Pseudoroseicyclus aestuarii]
MATEALLRRFTQALGPAHVLTGGDTAPWARDWTGAYQGEPAAVLRPADTAQVSAVLAIAHEAGTPIVPAGGRTGLTGATHAPGAVVLSLDRLSRIREIRREGRVAVVEAGVVLSHLHEAAEAEDLSFPLTLGARGSATIGGLLSTNAGGPNVLRHGNARDLCLGIEAVMADGRVCDLMGALHKDNSGYHLRDLLIGAEGTLGVITAATLKLAPRPRAHATAMVALPALPPALRVLNAVQDATGGAVEAFELMPRSYIEAWAAHTGGRRPFEGDWPVTIMIEVATTSDVDAAPGPQGQSPLAERLETVLAALLEDGTLGDAVIAQNEAQRAEIWARREAAAEVTFARRPFVDTDVALPLDLVADYLERIGPALQAIDPGVGELVVAHLGDGNIHYTAYPTRDDAALKDALREAIDALATRMGGSFSAEHGVGLSKRASMARHKDPAALAAMHGIKAALDPKGILNPGKVLP